MILCLSERGKCKSCYQRIQGLVSPHLSHCLTLACVWPQPWPSTLRNKTARGHWLTGLLEKWVTRPLNPARALINQPINHHLVTERWFLICLEEWNHMAWHHLQGLMLVHTNASLNTEKVGYIMPPICPEGQIDKHGGLHFFKKERFGNSK